MDKSRNPLKVALHGMDARSSKMMALYLQGPCKGIAVVVANENADVDIFDADSMPGQKLLKERQANGMRRPVIILSLNPVAYAGVIGVKKPVKTDEMVAALAWAKSQIGLKEHPQSAAKAERQEAMINRPSGTPDSGDSVTAKPTVDTVNTQVSEASENDKPVLKRFVLNTDEQKKTSKHQAAMQLSEKGFGAFIGNVSGLDVNDPKQFALAVYEPKEYFQGYVDSAFKISRSKGHVRQLNSGWMPLLIFPQSHEVWLDSDDNQLRSFAGLAINKSIASKMSVTPLSKELAEREKILDKYQSMDAFLWKAACWASKGRYPASMDIGMPVYLKCWPNFTRLLVTPHALRIAALLMRGPRTLPNIAESLNIKPQYVFVFISAASALGLAGQVKRDAGVLIQPPEVKPTKNQGVLGRILSTLLGRKA